MMANRFVHLDHVNVENDNVDDDDDDEDHDGEEEVLITSFAGLDMNKFIDTIKSDTDRLWIFVDNYGTAHKWRCQNNRFLKLNNIMGRRNYQLNEISSSRLWSDFRKLMNENSFIQITMTKNAKLSLYYCHRRILSLNQGQNLLIFGHAFICFHNFNDVNLLPENLHKMERMRHLKLTGRWFKFRCQSNSNKLFLSTNDIIDNRVEFDWIQQLPIVTTESTSMIDNNDENQNNNNQNNDEQLPSNNEEQNDHWTD